MHSLLHTAAVCVLSVVVGTSLDLSFQSLYVTQVYGAPVILQRVFAEVKGKISRVLFKSLKG